MSAFVEPIRLATPEEIETIKSTSDLEPGCTVVAFPQGEGKEPMFAVMRQVYEVDPVYYNGAPIKRKALFIWALENMMRFSGVPTYYFNVPANDTEYIETVKHWGAEVTSREPEVRLKKRLNNV